MVEILAKFWGNKTCYPFLNIINAEELIDAHSLNTILAEKSETSTRKTGGGILD